jgi:hypothetical protein
MNIAKVTALMIHPITRVRSLTWRPPAAGLHIIAKHARPLRYFHASMTFR